MGPATFAVKRDGLPEIQAVLGRWTSRSKQRANRQYSTPATPDEFPRASHSTAGGAPVGGSLRSMKSVATAAANVRLINGFDACCN